jgi:hypothetical protein
VISREDWEKKLKEVSVNKQYVLSICESLLTASSIDVGLLLYSDLNKLVMNYLVIEGYKEAAETFMSESGTDASTSFPLSDLLFLSLMLLT